MSLPSSAAEGNPHFLSKQLHGAEASSIWESQQGLQPRLSCSLAFALAQQRQMGIFVFRLARAFREKSVGKPNWPFSYNALYI